MSLKNRKAAAITSLSISNYSSSTTTFRNSNAHRRQRLRLQLQQQRPYSAFPPANMTLLPHVPLIKCRGQVPKRTTSYTIISSNKAIQNHINNGDLVTARHLFENMTVKTTVSWNLMLKGYAKPGMLEEALRLFERIPQPDVFSFTIMLSCYFRNSDLEGARHLFNRMPFRDSASWNTMISGLCSKGKTGEALDVFMAMPWKNDISWSVMISGYVQEGNLDSAVELFNRVPTKERGIISCTAMITGFMSFGIVGSAEELFHKIPERCLVTWNSMVAGYVENFCPEKGLKLFRTMVGLAIRPNQSTFSSVLLGCSNLSSLDFGKQVHQFIQKFPLYLNTTCGNSLLSMYCKCGDVEDAYRLFCEMQFRDVVTWNAMISGYAQHGHGEKAIEMFNEMIKEGMRPDSITFVGVLLACNHAGLVELGIHYFHSMKNYKVETRPDHYTCMVDLLGRAGLLAEAIDLIHKMPFQRHSPVFATLLGACRIHKNLELAEFAAKKLLDLDPSSTDGYVQLANVYAEMKRWDDVAWVRQLMKENKVVKTPGCSWIEVNKNTDSSVECLSASPASNSTI